MPRNKQQRTVCRMPKYNCFAQSDISFTGGDAVVMSIEEYEAIRLIDRLGLTQEECASYMQVARTTVQQIYSDARKKLSLMLVDGRPLVIKGGAYRLCDGTGRQCGCGGCRHFRHGRRMLPASIKGK